MKAIFDQHAQKLSPAERQATWEGISGRRAGAVREFRVAWGAWPRALAATATVAVAVLVFVVLQREPVGSHLAQPGPAKGARSVVGADGRPPAVAPAAPAPHAAIPIVPIEPARKLAPTRARGEAALPAATIPEPTDAAAPASPGVVPAPPVPATIPGTGSLVGRVLEGNGRPVAYANVIVLGTRLGGMTDENGAFVIKGIAPGAYQAKLLATGYDPVLLPVQVQEGATVTADFTVGAAKSVKQLEELQVTAERRLDTKSSTTKTSISAEKLREIPVDNLAQSVAGGAGVVAQGGELHFRGGRPGETHFQHDGVEIPGQPPVVPTTGGTRLPNDEPYDSMFFRNYGVNPFVETDEDALSTFAVDVDAASYTVARRYLELGHLPPADAVRVEEFVNFFAQGYPRFEKEDFRILLDGAPSPFGAGYQLLRVGIKGREIAARDRRPVRLTFVIDVSGSMAREDRLELVKKALRILVGELRDDDRVGIVVFGTRGRVLLPMIDLGRRIEVYIPQLHPDARAGEVMNGDEWDSGRRMVLRAIDQLRPEGSTNAEEGLRLGYDMARRMYGTRADNRIVLCSDGVANVGRTGPESILATVRTEADRGIRLTTIGFGMGNYNDVLMEQLADQGDGNHFYVDDLDEARRVFALNLTGMLQVIAKDAKVQVEFDSTRVVRWRLLGFENRDVADRDFRNDQVDAGEIGAGHEVTALYEVKLVPGVERGRIATVRFRYARPEAEAAGAPDVRELEQRLDASALERRFADASPYFRRDAAVAEAAELLRHSYWAKDGRLSSVLPVARAAARDLGDEASREFVDLLVKATRLQAAEPGGVK